MKTKNQNFTEFPKALIGASKYAKVFYQLLNRAKI